MCRQALVDAGERYNAAGALLSSAATHAELAVAQRIVIEGLTATRIVRQHQGLPLGPELPTPATPTVCEPTAVTINDQRYVAHPDYHPERPHFFGGATIADPGRGFGDRSWNDDGFGYDDGSGYGDGGDGGGGDDIV